MRYRPDPLAGYRPRMSSAGASSGPTHPASVRYSILTPEAHKSIYMQAGSFIPGGIGGWGLGAGDWGLETGDWGLETGDWRLETGDWGLETGDWGLGTGDWGLGKPCLRSPESPSPLRLPTKLG